jgi:energy-coupling factor transporter transmembrane protein EcfT
MIFLFRGGLMNNNVIVRGGVSGLTLLGLVFLVLKLIGKIAWSWWWVLAPFWGPLAIGLFLVVVAWAFNSLLRSRNFKRFKNK